MTTSAYILKDSISPDGVRLTTLILTFPRFILAELNTHRMFSRNSASSRAIPTELLIERVRSTPFVPLTFNRRVKGMGVGDELDETLQAEAREEWSVAAEAAANSAERLMEIGLDKSRANRLLEPFLWHTAIVSSTEWDNFYALRDHPAAQPEFRLLAQMMRAAMDASTPAELGYGEWHLPFVRDADLTRLTGYEGSMGIEEWKKISASRCAAVSYERHSDNEPIEKSIQRAERLMESGHLSPFEHVARPADEPTDPHGEGGVSAEFYGNFRGWVQFRKEIPNEGNFALAGAVESA